MMNMIVGVGLVPTLIHVPKSPLPFCTLVVDTRSGNKNHILQNTNLVTGYFRCVTCCA